MDPTRLLAALLGFSALAAAVAVPAYFGARKPGYSQVRDTISELGEAGSPVRRPVSYFGFIPIGLLVWAFLAVAAQFIPGGRAETPWLLSLVGWGYVGGALFCCDEGGPAVGSWRNAAHVLFGYLEYFGAAAGFITLAEAVDSEPSWAPIGFVAAGGGYIVGLCLLGIAFPHPFRGLVQRIAEAIIFGGLALIGLRILLDGR